MVSKSSRRSLIKDAVKNFKDKIDVYFVFFVFRKRKDTMGMHTDFIGTLTTSRPLTSEEFTEYRNEYCDSDMYLIFVKGSTDKLEGPCCNKVAGYVDMKKGFLDTLYWLKSKGITLTGRITYAYEDIFTDEIGVGFGAFVATPEKVTYYRLDFNGLQIVSDIID
jgi:hypothetical protein